MAERESVPGICRIEARDPAKHSLLQDSPATKNYLAQNGNSAEVNKPWAALMAEVLQEMRHCNWKMHAVAVFHLLD